MSPATLEPKRPWNCPKWDTAWPPRSPAARRSSGTLRPVPESRGPKLLGGQQHGQALALVGTSHGWPAGTAQQLQPRADHQARPLVPRDPARPAGAGLGESGWSPRPPWQSRPARRCEVSGHEAHPEMPTRTTWTSRRCRADSPHPALTLPVSLGPTRRRPSRRWAQRHVHGGAAQPHRWGLQESESLTPPRRAEGAGDWGWPLGRGRCPGPGGLRKAGGPQGSHLGQEAREDLGPGERQ